MNIPAIKTDLAYARQQLQRLNMKRDEMSSTVLDSIQRAIDAMDRVKERLDEIGNDPDDATSDLIDAVKSIAAMEPGSRGSYQKFVQARDRACEVVAKMNRHS